MVHIMSGLGLQEHAAAPPRGDHMYNQTNVTTNDNKNNNNDNK